MAAIPQVVYPQNPLNSKTILVNIFGSVLTFLVAKYGLGAILTPDMVNQVAMGAAMTVMAVVNIVLRKYTNGQLSFDAPLSQPQAQDLPTAGTVAVTTQHPLIGGPAAIVPLAPGATQINVPAPFNPVPVPALQGVQAIPVPPPVIAPPAQPPQQ